MLYRDFGKTGWKVSAVGQGLWNIGNQWGEMDEGTAINIIRAALDGGMNMFDVAEAYGIPNGLSEMRLGKALAGGIRDRVYIVSKIGHWGKRTGAEVPKTTADMIRLSGHAIVGRLQTTHVDLMLCHDGSIDDPTIYLEGFEALQKEGFIREHGISTDSLAVLKKYQECSGGKCAAVQVNYSLVNLAPEEALLPYCREQGIAVMVRGPVAMGLLNGRYNLETVFTDTVREKWNRGQSGRAGFETKMARVETIKAALPEACDLVTAGLRYVISHDTDPVAIPGATTVEQAIANAKAGEALMDRELLEKVRGV